MLEVVAASNIEGGSTPAQAGEGTSDSDRFEAGIALVVKTCTGEAHFEEMPCEATGVVLPQNVPCKDAFQVAPELHDQHADMDLDDGAALATLQGFDCLAFWTLFSSRVIRTDTRKEVVISYQHAPEVGNINRHADEAVDALSNRHVWPDALPVRVFFERNA